MRRIPAKPAQALIAFVVGSALFASATVFERDTLYNHIVIRDEWGIRTLYFNRFPQTQMSLQDPSRGHFEYVDYVSVAMALKQKVKKVLVLGLGGGSIPKMILRQYPDVIVHTVDIDPWVVRVARDYFGVTESDRHRIIVQDARQYLRQTKEKYDLIMADAYHADYYGSYIPYHLATREFFALIRDHLEPGGIVMYNVIGTLTGWQNRVVRSLYKTMNSEFRALYVIPMSRIYNVEIFGVKDAEPMSVETLLQTTRERVEKGELKDATLLGRVSQIITQPIVTDDVPLLTDDYAPVETLEFRWGNK
ncbi:MAG: spermidine synthase [bacterium JZ-2024 1]